MVKEAPLKEGYHQLEKGILVTTDDYWASHFDFNLGNHIKSPTLLGTERADDIIVNIILPFTFAWGKFTSQPELVRKALSLYYGYPKLGINAVERHMNNQLGLTNNLSIPAQRQQGLIHIYKTLCTQGKCNCCRLNQPQE